VEPKNISDTFPELEKYCDEFFNKEDKAYLFPLIAGWAGSDIQAVYWFKNERIPALGEKTGLEICRKNQQEEFIKYIHQIEYGSFA
jgi:hypothetical protein